ncbi:MAG: MBOAT family O-acyltransferase [Tissierellia bacterium]|nr:MBOAT family O-acyltransferase [Tissierellia bacterium]
MVFSSLIFIYYFLPLSVISYYAVGNKYKNAVIAFYSLLFFFLGEPKYVWLLLTVVAISYIYGIIYLKSNDFVRKFTKYIAIVGIFLFLLYYKYFDFMIEQLNLAFGLNIDLFKISLPLGISFYVFQATSYVLDVYRKDIAPERSIINYISYLTFFPQLIAGPIVRYKDVQYNIYHKEVDFEKISRGIYRFILGLGKKVLLANQLGMISSIDNHGSTLIFWLKSIAFTLQIYFDFSGYSDMAVGMGQMFGYDFPENFNYPFISKSVTEFWKRWHMTLSIWFREYLYIPLGGNKVSIGRWILNIIVVWIFTGLWHGAGWNFIVWGLIMAIMIIMEKIFNKYLDRMPDFIRIFFTFIFINISFVIFESNTLTEAIYSLKTMFLLENLEFSNPLTVFYLKDNWFLIVISLIFSMPITSKVKLNERLEKLVILVISVIILYLSTASLVGDSFNPFLYFRF